MKYILMLICLAVAGCASSPQKTYPVDVQVNVPCTIKEVDIPDFAVDTLPLGSGIYDQMKSLRADRIQRKAYESVLEQAIKSCQ